MAPAAMIDEATRTAAAGRPLGAISTLVSLFLLLLVFFIVLFSIAEVHRQRVQQVVTSIDLAFGGLPSRLGLLPPAAPVADAASPEGFARAVSTLVTGFAPLEAAGRDAPGGALLEIELPPDRLFEPGAADLKDAATALVPPLAVLLQRQPNAQQHYRLTFRIVAPDGAADADTALAVARAGRFATALYAAGCPGDALAVGIEQGSAKLLRLDFAVTGAAPDGE